MNENNVNVNPQNTVRSITNKLLTLCGYAATALMLGAFFIWALFLAPMSVVM